MPIIKEKYPKLYNANLKDPMLKIRKLAQENARYFVSIFFKNNKHGIYSILKATKLFTIHDG